MIHTLNVATYNMHKGFSNFNRRLMVHELREELRKLHADLIFLQEVQGAHQGHSLRHANWPALPQHEFLADSIWRQFAYGKNSVYDDGHHGNAILSRYPIVSSENEDVSAHQFEQRGMLHCVVNVPGWNEWLHAVCVHLGLFARGRRKQVEQICDRIDRVVPHDAPLVIAGDFNDWQVEVSHTLQSRLGVHEAFELTKGRPARSFPAGFPLLRLDRIYVRGVRVKHVKRHSGHAWTKLSDHSALSASLAPL